MKRKLSIVVIFFISFFAGVLYFGEKYYKFGLSIENLVLLFAKPLYGTDKNVARMLLWDTTTHIIIPSILVTLLIIFLPKILLNKYAKRFYDVCIGFFKQILSKSIGFSFCIGMCFLIIAANKADDKLNFIEYAWHKYGKRAPYSTFYENHYVIPNTEDFTQNNTRNLVVIFSESMESTYSNKNIPHDAASGGMGGGIELYSPHGELIPNLTRYAQQGVNFSATSVIGGHFETERAKPTFPAITAYMCGFPPIYNRSTENEFTKKGLCISDILHNKGYFQAIFTGARGTFGGYDNFAKEHYINVYDVQTFKEKGLVPEDYNGHWGIEDYRLFSLAKDFLNNYDENKPFALYLSTVDTHFPGYVDAEFCADMDFAGVESNGGNNALYENSIKCGDRIISDFVEFIKKSRFGKNTTIVILGDHLTMQSDFIPINTHRFVYNVFINPTFSRKPTYSYVKNRKLSNYDFTPLILDSIGFQVKAFALGRNPLYKQTLVEEYGTNGLELHLKQPTRFFFSDTLGDNKNP